MRSRIDGHDGAQGEIVLPFPMPRDRIPDGTHFRSTWLTASQQSIRARGYGDAYERHLDPAFKEQVLSIVPGVWMPMEVARAHYTACDALALSTTELVEIGMQATMRANASALDLAVRLARGAGATPWTIMTQIQRIWDRTSRGGAVGIWKLGPKEARMEVVGYPLAGLRYNRITFRGITQAIVGLFCTRVYVQEIPTLCSARTLGFRLSWV
jgi:hypothetical protein